MSAGVVLVVGCIGLVLIWALASQMDKRHRTERAILHVWDSLSTLEQTQVKAILEGKR